MTGIKRLADACSGIDYVSAVTIFSTLTTVAAIVLGLLAFAGPGGFLFAVLLAVAMSYALNQLLLAQVAVCRN